MRVITASILFLASISVSQAQIAAVFSSVEKTSDCSSWSEWGECFWPYKVLRVAPAISHPLPQTTPPLSSGRKLTPFYVAEEVCTARQMGGKRQNQACKANAAVLKRNTGRDCQMWPVSERVVPLPGVDAEFKKVLYRLKWSNCIQDRRQPKYCRCCCFPFQPDPKTNSCKLMPGKPLPPGLN